MDIGHKIKQLRMQKNLTLEELASRCELTKGFLSQLENDISSPSISTLNDILEALGSSLQEFFSQDEKNVKTVFHESDFFEDEKDNYSISWIVPNTQKNDMEPILITIPENGESFEMAPHSGEEFGYVLEGSVVLMVGDKGQTVKKGETFYLHGKEFHKIINKNKKTAKVLWVSTPPSF
ncbi:MAG: helix-turn-helix transcriptional regulator [Lachnospiraceae bacterium]|nr:helix-turn-helix transcriptional regulator [Lachnospiraceae bacterium]